MLVFDCIADFTRTVFSTNEALARIDEGCLVLPDTNTSQGATRRRERNV